MNPIEYLRQILNTNKIWLGVGTCALHTTGWLYFEIRKQKQFVVAYNGQANTVWSTTRYFSLSKLLVEIIKLVNS